MPPHRPTACPPPHPCPPGGPHLWTHRKLDKWPFRRRLVPACTNENTKWVSFSPPGNPNSDGKIFHNCCCNFSNSLYPQISPRLPFTSEATSQVSSQEYRRLSRATFGVRRQAPRVMLLRPQFSKSLCVSVSEERKHAAVATGRRLRAIRSRLRPMKLLGSLRLGGLEPSKNLDWIGGDSSLILQRGMFGSCRAP